MSEGVGGAPLVLHEDEYDYDDDDYQVFLDDSDIMHEVLMDDGDLPDALDLDLHDDDDDEEQFMEQRDVCMNEFHGVDDDSVHIFTRHTVFHASPGERKLKEVYSVECSPKDATLVATGGGDDRGFLWRIGQEQNLASELQGHNDSVSALAFSHDGQILASGDLNGKIKLWNEDGKLEHALDDGPLIKPGRDIQWLRWHPMEHVLLAGCVGCEYSIWMWKTTTDRYPKKLTGFGVNVTCGDFTPDGKSICTGSEDGSVRVVNITSRKVSSTRVSHSGSITCVGFAPGSDGWATTGSTDQTLVIWNISHPLDHDHATCNHEGAVTCLAWLNARHVATGCEDGKVRIWDRLSGKCVRIFKGHSDSVESLSVSANKDYLVSASLDGTARVFEVQGFQ